jgi:hypothetical protein
MVSCSSDSKEESGVITITGIPSHYNGMYALFHADNDNGRGRIRIEGYQEKAEGGAHSTLVKFIKIINGKVSLPLFYIIGGPPGQAEYDGNHTFITNTTGNFAELAILDVPQIYWTENTWNQHLIDSFHFQSVTFKNGNANIIIDVPKTITIP